MEAKTLGLTVQWDRDFSVRVSVSAKHAQKTCGMCGVMDDDDSDDMVVGPSSICMPKDATVSAGDLVSNQQLPSVEPFVNVSVPTS